MVNRHRRLVDSFAWQSAVFVSSVGFVVLLGWVLDVPFLKSIGPRLATMKVNTALAFVMAGVAVVCPRQSRAGWRTTGRCLSLGVTALGAATLAQYLFAVDFGIDELLVADDGRPALYPGRPSPVTAASFLLAGVALVDLNWRAPGGTLARWCSLAVLVLGSLALTGYVYDVDALYRVVPYTSMAVHTAAMLVILSLSVIASQPTAGLVGIAISDTGGGTLARHLIPLITIVFLLLGWAWLAGERAGFYDGPFSMSVMALSSTVVGVAMLTHYAVLLHTADLSRRQAEADARQLSAALADRKFEALIESAPDGMVIVNENGTIVLVNARTEELFGYPRQELLGHTVDVLLPDSLRADHVAHRAAFVRDPRHRPMSAKVDLRARRKDGTEFPVEVSLGPLQTESGLLVSSTVRDVTARRQAEEALRESNERFSFASRAAGVGYWDVDMTSNRVVWSDTYRALHGLPADANRPRIAAASQPF
jgi:PAS domain S-box-containing protein